MLHYETIEPGALELLKRLQAIPELKDYRLVGGTALALILGHRKSVDLDLFCHGTFSPELVRGILKQNKLKVVAPKSSTVYYGGFIDKVKVDFVKDFDGWLKPPLKVDGIKLAQIEDLAAMKTGAITGRGAKKDFSDLYYLLQKFSVEDLVNFYAKRTKQKVTYDVLLSMAYFEDAEKTEMPFLLDKKLTWEKIKKEIAEKVRKFSKE